MREHLPSLQIKILLEFQHTFSGSLKSLTLSLNKYRKRKAGSSQGSSQALLG